MALVFLLEQTAVGFYLAIFGLILWTGWSLLAARRDYRMTQFELERDLARYRRSNALTVMVLLIEAGLFVAGIQTVVAPTMRETLNLSQNEVVAIDRPFNTPTPGALATIAINDSGIELNPTDPASGIRVTPIPTATPVGTILPNPAESVGCETPQAQLQIPANGMRVYQITEVRGTAFTENFTSYKIEIRGGIYSNWISLAQLQQPVEQIGSLYQFVPSDFEPDWYEFRLAVFDNTGTLRASCMVNIRITAPVATPTPIGS